MVMVAEWRIQEKMLQSVADALGPELLHHLRNHIARATADLLAHRDFAYAVQSAAGQNRGREVIIFQRLKEIATPSFTQ